MLGSRQTSLACTSFSTQVILMIGGFGHAPSVDDVLSRDKSLVPWMNTDAGCIQ